MKESSCVVEGGRTCDGECRGDDGVGEHEEGAKWGVGSGKEARRRGRLARCGMRQKVTPNHDYRRPF